LDNDVPSTVVVTYEGIAVGSVDVPAHIEEPLLPWLVRELCVQLRDELLIAITSRALPGLMPIELQGAPAVGGPASAPG
jgi:hypothetical protein